MESTAKMKWPNASKIIFNDTFESKHFTLTTSPSGIFGFVYWLSFEEVELGGRQTTSPTG
jgi:hypothetical protein